MSTPDSLLKTQQVAIVFGVSVSTIKRWVDAGSLGASRTVGKHRLIPLGEALRLAREQSLPRAQVQMLLGLGSAAAPEDQARGSLIEALEGGRGAEARALIFSAYARSRGASRLADDLIRPAMEAVGHGWAAGDLDVYEEHRATRIVEGTLLELNARAASDRRGPAVGLAVGATPEGDHYTLSGLLCELALRELGWDVMNLGPNLPLASLAKAVRVHRPRLAWLSVNHLADAERFVLDYEGFHASAAETHTAVCLGGSALAPALRARLVAASFGERVVHLAEFARRLVPANRSNVADRKPTEEE